MPRLGHIFFEVNNFISRRIFMNMEKSKQTLKALIVGLVLLILGVSMIVIGVVLNNYLKKAVT